jgi:hypothetical protein
VPAYPELTEIVRAAASLLPRTRRAIARCRTDPDPGGELARECGDVVREYVALWERLQVLPRDELSHRVARLLRCQMELIAQASHLAFRIHDETWPRMAAHFGDGQGAAADELLYLAADLSRPSPVG